MYYKWSNVDPCAYTGTSYYPPSWAILLPSIVGRITFFHLILFILKAWGVANNIHQIAASLNIKRQTKHTIKDD